MRGRVGALVLVLGLFAAGLAAGAIKAGPTAPPTTPTDTTTEATTTEDVTTTTAPTTTTVPTTTTTVAPPPAHNAIDSSPIGSGSCVIAAFALQAPGGQTRVLGRTASKHDVAAYDVAFPADGSIVTAGSVALRAAGCDGKGHAEVRALSLFGGAVTARSVALAASKNVADSAIRIDGLTIAGKAASLRAGRPQSVGNWGYVLADAEAGGTDAGALAVHLTKAHAGLPAGTVLLVSFVRVPVAPKKAAAPTPQRTAEPKVHRQARAHTQRRASPPKRKRHPRPRKRLGDDAVDR